MVFYVRAGFEGACAEEVRAHAHPVSGEVNADPGSGFVVFAPHRAEAAERLASTLQFSDLVFARQMFFSSGRLGLISPGDQVTRVMDEAAALHATFSEIFVETADTNEAKACLGLCRRLEVPLRTRLRDSGRLLEDARGPRLHVFLVSPDAAYMGLSWASNASPWFMGIPRLRWSKGAPSRSSLKLVEAFAAFLAPAEQATRLRPGGTAVDLGAAPGGWSFELARRGLAVVAVDNGRLDPQVLASGCVTHLRADGFRFRPRKPVDWMVCDMVDKPSRIAVLVAEWMASGLCR
ncbi:MAG: 23S rRNA (cytidine(2498)-2'-O)-methyltransferase RlmM, partial [Betaproteobacteria bacterium]|nr:23S rRNA (cytidine(2498)-2'-O)-methyltransferase RlmM [Betaproteobacteria bacterium]